MPDLAAAEAAFFAAAPESGTRVLILDGHTRTALAVVRSLGKKRLECIVAAGSQRSLAQASKYAADSLVCPDPDSQADEYLNWLVHTVQRIKPDLLLPLTDISVSLAAAAASKLRGSTRLVLVKDEVLRSVSNKGELGRTASSLGLNSPEVLLLPAASRSRAEEMAEIRQFKFPAVLKPVSSVSIIDGEALHVPVFYPENAEQVIDIIQGRGDDRLENVSFLLQQRVTGRGCGVFAVCNHGEALAVFCHGRLLEKPPSGGVSVLCESIPEVEAPVEEALTLLKHYAWHGAAMVEFKQDASGAFYLIEINPRFWGSLQLAIDCGRDFPYILYLLSLCRSEKQLELLREYCQALAPYAAGRRLRWLLGTIDHAIIRLKESPLAFASEGLLHNRLGLFEHWTETRWEVLRWDDPRPFFCELIAWIKALLPGRKAKGEAPENV